MKKIDDQWRISGDELQQNSLCCPSFATRGQSLADCIGVVVYFYVFLWVANPEQLTPRYKRGGEERGVFYFNFGASVFKPS
jgi:hypothetical protein